VKFIFRVRFKFKFSVGVAKNTEEGEGQDLVFYDIELDHGLIMTFTLFRTIVSVNILSSPFLIMTKNLTLILLST